MKKKTNVLTQIATNFTHAMRWELKHIFRDKPVFFSLVGVAIVVSFLYTYLYSKEILTELPLGIVDEDNTAQSRQVLRMIDASSQAFIYKAYITIDEAKEAFQRDEIRGLVLIPKHFARDLQRLSAPMISVYADASYMLYYKQLVTAVKTSVAFFNAGVQVKQTSSEGKIPKQVMSEVSPISTKVVSLYNPSSGYATFIIPLVLVIIFQTTILTAIGILNGEMREKGILRRMYPKVSSLTDVLGIVMGRISAYLLITLTILLIFIGIVMPLYNIPIRSEWIPIFIYMIPFLIAVVGLGISLLNLFHKKEDAIMFVLYTSIPSMMITGFSWADTDFPAIINYFSYLIPTTLGAKGFVSLTQMGASLSTISSFFLGMWALALIYLALACATMWRFLK